MYYPSSGYCEADLRLCFCLCRLLVFPCGGSYIKILLNNLLLKHAYHFNEGKLSCIMRKPDFCLCKTKGADQLCNNCRLSTDSYIPIKLLYFGSKSYIFKHLLYSYKFSYILKIFPIFLGKFVADEYIVNSSALIMLILPFAF